MAGRLFPPLGAGVSPHAGPADASYSSVEPCAANEIATAKNSTAVAAEPPLPAPADDAASADDAKHASSQNGAGQDVDAWRFLQHTTAVAADQSAPAPASKNNRPIRHSNRTARSFSMHAALDATSRSAITADHAVVQYARRFETIEDAWSKRSPGRGS